MEVERAEQPGLVARAGQGHAGGGGERREMSVLLGGEASRHDVAQRESRALPAHLHRELAAIERQPEWIEIAAHLPGKEREERGARADQRRSPAAAGQRCDADHEHEQCRTQQQPSDAAAPGGDGAARGAAEDRWLHRRDRRSSLLARADRDRRYPPLSFDAPPRSRLWACNGRSEHRRSARRSRKHRLRDVHAHDRASMLWYHGPSYRLQRQIGRNRECAG